MQFSGIVKHGKRRGSALGYPTVNIDMHDARADGIYAALVTAGEQVYQAAAFADPYRGVVEAYLIDFFGDLYDRNITIELLKKMRDSEAFHSDAALKSAIAEDVNSVRQYFSDTN